MSRLTTADMLADNTKHLLKASRDLRLTQSSLDTLLQNSNRGAMGSLLVGELTVKKVRLLDNIRALRYERKILYERLTTLEKRGEQ